VMARYLISLPAQDDLRHILAASAERWGDEGGRRYARRLADAMRRIAATPNGPNTHSRGQLLAGLRSFHIRHVRGSRLSANVREPVHIIYYRILEGDLVEIVRVLHERMEPARHVGEASEGGDEPA